MNSPSKPGFGHPGPRAKALIGELEGVRKLLHKLRHNRGRWPRKWVTGMLAHYEKREAKLEGDISRRARAIVKERQL